MSAQYRLGDIAGALEGFTAARSALRDCLGVEPGDELQRLQHAILNRTLDIPQQNPVPGVVRSVRLRTDRTVPRQLPARPAFLAAGDDQLAAITGALAEPACGRARVVVVHGAPGSGTSALAITAAHQVAARFPDGQLYVDLRDVPAGDGADHVAGTILRGLADENPSAAGHGAVAWLRSALADRSILLVLDNVADPALVRPLIPTGQESAVLVAGCQPIWTVTADLRVATTELSVATATQLVLADGSRPLDESAAALAARLCGQLPLALSIVAARLASRPDLSLRILARRLRDERTRLDELCFEGLAVRNSLTRCHQQICGRTAPADDLAATRLFDVIGSRSARRVDVRQLVTVLAEPASVVTRAGERLADVGLVTATGARGRYCVPELTRLFAAELAANRRASPSHDRLAARRVERAR
jgi:hypothetical protein